MNEREIKREFEILYGEISVLKERLEDLKPFSVYAKEQEELEDMEEMERLDSDADEQAEGR